MHAVLSLFELVVIHPNEEHTRKLELHISILTNRANIDLLFIFSSKIRLPFKTMSIATIN